MTSDRIYLDNAATSWPKPDTVYDAVMHALRVLGAPAGRSAYREASEVERLILDARRRAARLLAIDDPNRIIFTCNGTDSLNMALHGLLRPGDHVVTSVLEHNSVLRPLRHLAGQGIEVTRVGCSQDGVVDPDEIQRSVRPTTKAIALLHVSNVTGAIQPVADVGRIAAEYGIEFLLDAAQSLGHLAFQASDVGCTLLAAPGHKGLLSPLGLGLLYVAPGRENMLSPFRQGGTGTQSETDRQPETLPDKFESGNHNVPAILGLGAALEFIETRQIDNIYEHERTLTTQLLAGLGSVNGIRIHGPGRADQQLGVVSVTVDGYDPREVASMVDTAYAIQVRSGFHCAPHMHQRLGTADSGGTVRFSVGQFNTEQQMDLAINAVAEIAASVR